MASLFDRYQKEKRLKKNAQKVKAQTQKSPQQTAAKSDLNVSNALTVIRLSHEGRGVARDALGKTMFISGALPGEEVTAQVTQSRSKYNNAVISTLHKASDDRVEPPCPHFEQCGGCNLQHFQHSAQIAFKQSVITEHLQRANIIDEQTQHAAPIGSAPYGYRRKARLGVTRTKSQGLVLGFRERNSKRLTTIQQCPILVPQLQPLVGELQSLLPRLRGQGHIGHIELIAEAQQANIILRITQPLHEGDQRTWFDWAEQLGVRLIIASTMHAQQSEEREIADSENDLPERLHYEQLYPVSSETPQFSYTLGELTIHFNASDFLQVNQEVNQQMVSQALTWLNLSGSEHVLDLFCGFGNFTLPLAQYAKRVVGIEGVASQVAQGTVNAKANSLNNITFLCTDLNKPIANFSWAKEKFDVVLLDPPRAGAEEICSQLSHLGAQKILYVSCNPITLARDAAILKEQGYQLTKYGMLDMFPQTAHMESMALFTRVSP